MRPGIFILGGGGHAQVVLDALAAMGWRDRIRGILDPVPEQVPGNPFGVQAVGGEEMLDGMAGDEALLVNGLGSVGDPEARRALYRRFRQRGFRFPPVVHPSAVRAMGVIVGDGAQIMAGTVLQTGVRVGINAIVNTGARLDHHVEVGEHVHVAPGAVCCGEVHLGDGAHVGPGATVVQGVAIGGGAVVGAGAVVVRDVAPGVRVWGVPARRVAASA